ncbi:hypothetical protein KFL_009390050 [Klebsormidium nitens]|uniref:DNA primase/polymerase bifunctional N-terminal domain-containing protein n=1 Tax=Klebsormidium nitens TaxID=105231 RepID=A0A1Y1IRP7_KLENI|nr:hypothetical protein KFL_009390050 [Klebsormidium nitens]|eukprot:GAQ92179.1 hypothetical protein KFL_009390050 [Klebsormidium nitens]
MQSLVIARMEQATAPGPQAAKDSRALGLTAVADELPWLSNVGLYAIPVRLFWNAEKGTKEVDFPKNYAHITTPGLWEQSINEAMRQRMDANGVAILTGPSQLIVIDVDVSSSDTKKPDIELWDRLVEKHGEPQTLKAQSGSGGLHFYFKANSPGLKCTRNFSGIKVDKSVYGVDGRARGGVVFAYPARYVKDQGKLATYKWINGPPSFEACQEMPPWLTSFLNDHVQQTAADEIDTGKFVERHGSRENDSIATPSAMDHATSMPSAPLEDVQNTVALPGLERALEEIKKMLHAKVPNDASTFSGVGERTPNGWRILKFKTNGIRTCLNGHQHVSNQFSILSNGGVLVYRCLSLECIDQPKPLLGTYFWPECLPLRADGKFIEDCERYLLPFKPSEDKDRNKKKSKEDDDRTKKAKTDLQDLILRMMNHYFAVVVGTTRAVYFETIYSRDASGRIQQEETINRSGHNFLERCKNLQLCSLPGRSKEVAKFWESSPKRREYDQIVFEPELSKVSPRQFNLFCGLNFQPIERKLTAAKLVECEGKMPKLIWHIRNVLSDRSPERFEYNIKWMAHGVQRPWRKIQVALVFRGPQGCGKSTLWDFYGLKILGSKLYLYCNEIEKVIGRFNSLGVNKLLIVLDEAGNWGGAYKMNDRIKSAITQETTCLEHKGQDAITVQDRSNIVFTTNHSWPVKREADDRRYSCQECSGVKVGDKHYFDELLAELEDPQTAFHFHQYLSSIDIVVNWDPKKMPVTTWGEELRDHL